MRLFSKLRDFLLRKTPLTPSARAPASSGVSSRLDTVPPFHLGIVELMRFDPQIRIGLGARNGLLMSAEVLVRGERTMAAWVQQQWERIWATSAPQLLRTKLYGYLPFEVMYRVAHGGRFDGAIEFDRLEERHPRAARLLSRDGSSASRSTRTAGRSRCASSLPRRSSPHSMPSSAIRMARRCSSARIARGMRSGRPAAARRRCNCE